MEHNPKMDGFSAGLLLSAAAGGMDTERVVDLAKEMNKDFGGPSAEAVAFFETNKGKKCSIKGTGYTGEIVGLNKSTSGFYPGSSCPIYVKILSADDEKFQCAVGSVFEYALEQVELV